MVTRIKTNSVKNKWYYASYFNPASISFISDDHTLQSQIVGSDDPMFESKIRSGKSASNPMSAFRQRIAWRGGQVRVKRNGFPGVGFSNVMFNYGVIPPGIPQTLLDRAENDAAIGIRKKIHQQHTTVSGGVILGELKKTVHMIRHPAESINKLLAKFVNDRGRNIERARRLHARNAVRKRRNRKPIPGYTVNNGVLVETADTISKTWLELVFGLTPLMSDIAAIAEAALSKYSAPSIKRLMFTAQAASSTSLSGTHTPAGSPVDCAYNGEWTDEVSCRYTVGYQVAISGVQEGWTKVLSQSGFNLREAPQTAWNLLPWSFLIDYVSNIGDVLEVNAVSLENVVWSQLTTRRNARKLVSIHCSKGQLQPDAQFYYTFHGGNDYACSSTIVEVKRLVKDIPFGHVSFNMPTKDSQYQNMAALLWTQLSRKFIR